VTHLPLIILWVYAALGAFERASTAVKYLMKFIKRVFITPNDAGGGGGGDDDDDEEEDSDFAYSETKRLVGTDGYRPPRQTSRFKPSFHVFEAIP